MTQSPAVRRLTADLIAQIEAHCQERAQRLADMALAIMRPKAKRGRPRKVPTWFPTNPDGHKSFRYDFGPLPARKVR